MRVVIALLCLTGVLLSAGCAERTSASERTIELVSASGSSLRASLYAPDVTFPPGLVLLHRSGGNRSVWESFARQARQVGIMSIAVDLPGPDGNRRSGARQPMSDTDRERLLQDVATVLAALIEHGAHPDNLAIVGEEFGATLALFQALDNPRVQAVVMISPALDMYGYNAEVAIRELNDCPTLIMSSEGDAYAAMSAAVLKSAAPVFSEHRSWAGAAHGVDLFSTHPESSHFILQWLRSVITH